MDVQTFIAKWKQVFSDSEQHKTTQPATDFQEFHQLIGDILQADQKWRGTFPEKFRPAVFEDIFVASIEEMLMAWNGGHVWQGGPQLHAHHTSMNLEHFRGSVLESVPFKREILASSLPYLKKTIFWCGPISNHFGHQLGEFGGRVLMSSLDEREGLLFFLHPDPNATWDTLLPWQKEWITYLNPGQKEVFITGLPFIAHRLISHPQHQRIGTFPTVTLLAALHWRSQILAGIENKGIVILSRNKHSPALDAQTTNGCYAGEMFFDKILLTQNCQVIYPEELGLRDLLRLIHNAQTLIISEGSVIHALELTGFYPDKNVVLLARRPFWEGMDSSLRAHFPRLHWLDEVVKIYSVVGSNPRVKGIALLNWKNVLHKLSTLCGFTFSESDLLCLQEASARQIANLRAQSDLICTIPDKNQKGKLTSGGW